MAFTIPISSIAGPLAVSFTVAAPESVPVQVPQKPPEAIDEGPPVLPDAPAPASPPPEELAPTITQPAEPWPSPSEAPPALPSGDLASTEDEAPAPAPRPQVLAPTDKRGFFSLSIGGATESGYVSYYGGGGVGFNLEMIVGRHGRKRPNLGGAFVLQYRKGFLSEISLAGRFRARKQLTKAFSLYTVFDATLGISIPIAVGGYLYPYIPAAQIGVGWGLEAILAERVTLGLRPFAPNIVGPSFFSGYPVALRWDFGVSLGLVW